MGFNSVFKGLMYRYCASPSKKSCQCYCTG